MPLYAYAHDKRSKCPDFTDFGRMKDAALTKCPECGRAVHRVPQAAKFSFKKTGESTKESVKRVLGEKEQHFECPWPNAKTGKCEKVYLKGNKRERKAQVQDAVLRSKLAVRRNLTRADVDVPNI